MNITIQLAIQQTLVLATESLNHRWMMPFDDLHSPFENFSAAEKQPQMDFLSNEINVSSGLSRNQTKIQWAQSLP